MALGYPAGLQLSRYLSERMIVCCAVPVVYTRLSNPVVYMAVRYRSHAVVYMPVRYRPSGSGHDALLETGGVVLLQAEPQLCTLPGMSVRT